MQRLTTTQHAPFAAQAYNIGFLQCSGLQPRSMLPLLQAYNMLGLQPRSMLPLMHCQHRLPLTAAGCTTTQLLPLLRLPTVNCQPSVPAEKAACRSCRLPFLLPAESAEKEPCLLTDPALYTAAAWPRLYCRLTGPVQPITARRLLASAAAAQPIRPLLLCTCKQLERYNCSGSSIN
jgi:hypothetical protein